MARPRKSTKTRGGGRRKHANRVADAVPVTVSTAMRYIRTRLSSVFTFWTSWLAGRARHQKVLVQLNKWERIARNYRESAKIWKSESDRLVIAVMEQERELITAKREIDRLESERQLAGKEIQGLLLANARLQSQIKADTARSEASAVHVTNGMPHRDVLEDYR